MFYHAGGYLLAGSLIKTINNCIRLLSQHDFIRTWLPVTGCLYVSTPINPIKILCQPLFIRKNQVAWPRSLEKRLIPGEGGVASLLSSGYGSFLMDEKCFIIYPWSLIRLQIASELAEFSLLLCFVSSHSNFKNNLLGMVDQSIRLKSGLSWSILLRSGAIGNTWEAKMLARVVTIYNGALKETR